MKILIDTNVVLRNSVREEPQHPLVAHALNTLAVRGHLLCIAPQSLFEFWVVATRPKNVNGFGLAPSEARLRVGEILGAFELLPDPPDLVLRWADLCERYQVLGRPAHDARLTALMLSHGVTHLLSLNPADFTRYREITVLEPQDV